MRYLLESSANPDLHFWVSKLSKNSILGVGHFSKKVKWLVEFQKP